MAPANTLNTISNWDEAAKKPNYRGAIHPSGHVSTEAYEESGMKDFRKIRELIGFVRDYRVVDVGCGDGRITIPLACYYHDVWGADSSPTMLNRLMARAPVETLLTDGRQIQILEPVDACVCISVLIHHSHEDAARLIGYMSESLRPGGNIIQWLPLYEEGREPENWTDLSIWTLEELQNVAAANLLEIAAYKVNPGRFNHGDKAGPYFYDFTVLRKPL
jgi:2-polyprenyl-3-methyl-5-hydroxy-6-metoxy-1,4-benzoquinol methylase